MMGLASVYRKYSLQGEGGREASKQISWIKDKLLHIYYQNSIDDRFEKVFLTLCFHAIPFPNTLQHGFATNLELEMGVICYLSPVCVWPREPSGAETLKCWCVTWRQSSRIKRHSKQNTTI